MKKDSLLPFIRPNEKAYKRYVAYRLKEKIKLFFSRFRKVLKIISNIILWICAVGGFVLSLIQFFQDS